MTDFFFMSEEALIPTAIAVIATAVVLYFIFYLVAYQNKKSEVLKSKEEALKNGTEVNEIEVARVETFNRIYVFAMLLGIIIVSVGAFVLTASFIPEYVSINGTIGFVEWGIIATAVIFFLFDTFVGRPIADGTFKSKVIDPLRQKVIDKFQKPASDSKDTGEIALTDEQRSAILKAIGFKVGKN